ncbi:DUF418 domain-containing protein [Alkalicoccus halolimnae]|uniref:DUF418 domain-containing protein n=1 Tax=Alkalicoccus halolimnae TaxID=1667239 RepID=A0A5C7FJ43_9BACI|nr:DUF418 domain-containing protein [Alkalicoccus halolimnae]TXF86169.1 DUF418 domain-containing protein [Alkalicoccus halolimnae]
MASTENTAKGERIEILDRLRGFALLGILLMNFPGLAGVASDSQPLLRSFLEILIKDSARPLFAAMFGISIALIYDRTRERQRNPYPLLIRRLAILGIAGAVHGYAVWAGDILMMFAMAGFVLLFFLKLQDKWLLLLGLAFWLLYTVGLDFLNHYTPYLFDLETGMKSLGGEGIPGYTYLLREFSSMVSHLGFFLLGKYMYRKEAFSYMEANRRKMWVTAFFFFTVGFFGKTAMMEMPENLFINSLQTFFPFVLTIGVTIGVILLGTSPKRVSRLLHPFTAVGRTTFTNYLMQSVVFVTIFANAGRTIFRDVGIWSDPGYYFALSIAVSLFLAQMIISHFWLKKFYYGPFEWVWRAGTHGKFVSFRR